MSDNRIPSDDEFLAQRFEAHRTHLRAVAYRMLGSTAEADDAVQEAWIRLSRSETDGVRNLGGWLTTVVGRVCLDMLRSRRSRAEEPLEPSAGHARVADVPGGADPEQHAVLADSVGMALLVVLETLTPAERLAFVLHDLFAVPYEQVGEIVGRSPVAARQLASRARRRVQGADDAVRDGDPGRRQAVVDAFLAASREGDFDSLVALLDPDAVARTEAGVAMGAVAIAKGASSFRHIAAVSRPALVDGATGLAVFVDGRLDRTLAFTFVGDKIAAIDITTTPERVAEREVTLV